MFGLNDVWKWLFNGPSADAVHWATGADTVKVSTPPRVWVQVLLVLLAAR